MELFWWKGSGEMIYSCAEAAKLLKSMNEELAVQRNSIQSKKKYNLKTETIHDGTREPKEPKLVWFAIIAGLSVFTFCNGLLPSA